MCLSWGSFFKCLSISCSNLKSLRPGQQQLCYLKRKPRWRPTLYFKWKLPPRPAQGFAMATDARGIALEQAWRVKPLLPRATTDTQCSLRWICWPLANVVEIDSALLDLKAQLSFPVHPVPRQNVILPCSCRHFAYHLASHSTGLYNSTR
jgi:hypothetical protein